MFPSIKKHLQNLALNNLEALKHIYNALCVSDCVCVCVCEWLTDWECVCVSEWLTESVCVCVWVSDWLTVCVWEWVSDWVCVCCVAVELPLIQHSTPLQGVKSPDSAKPTQNLILYKLVTLTLHTHTHTLQFSAHFPPTLSGNLTLYHLQHSCPFETSPADSSCPEMILNDLILWCFTPYVKKN